MIRPACNISPLTALRGPAWHWAGSLQIGRGLGSFENKSPKQRLSSIASRDSTQVPSRLIFRLKPKRDRRRGKPTNVSATADDLGSADRKQIVTGPARRTCLLCPLEIFFLILVTHFSYGSRRPHPRSMASNSNGYIYSS
jgi:hypothetical protein